MKLASIRDNVEDILTNNIESSPLVNDIEEMTVDVIKINSTEYDGTEHITRYREKSIPSEWRSAQ